MYKIVSTLKDQGTTYALLQKVNLDSELELYRLAGDEEIENPELYPVIDEEEWNRVTELYNKLLDK